MDSHISIAEADMQAVFTLLREALEPKVVYTGDHYLMAQAAIGESQRKIMEALALLADTLPPDHPLQAKKTETWGMSLPFVPHPYQTGDSWLRSPKQALVGGRLLQALANMVAAFPDDSELQETYASIVAMNEYGPAPLPFPF
ncbi:MAG: hypothetical protein HND44_19610 [Chloroflexi bacterium]|nr:hypothetical protein [Ardenticatenaceae bacterium]NOG36753.1 hypothetical protein [Chloroflexota bacterium]